MKLSSDGKSIKYSNKELYTDFVKRYFTFPRSFKITGIEGFSYGAVTYTF